jgi:hypothetical protein
MSIGLRLASMNSMSTEPLEKRPTPHRLSPLAPLVRRIECDYEEMPGLRLTEAQAQRLWNLDADTCRTVLVALVQRGFLRRSTNGMYILGGA